MKNLKDTKTDGQNLHSTAISEDSLQAKCHIWLWNTYPKLRFCAWHVANERKVSPREGAILKAKGVVAGVPDYVFNYAGKVYYFELKTTIGVISPAQKMVHEALRAQDFEVFIIRNFETFKNIIKSIVIY
jgi:hypothetical protein